MIRILCGVSVFSENTIDILVERGASAPASDERAGVWALVHAAQRAVRAPGRPHRGRGRRRQLHTSARLYGLLRG